MNAKKISKEQKEHISLFTDATISQLNLIIENDYSHKDIIRLCFILHHYVSQIHKIIDPDIVDRGQVN